MFLKEKFLSVSILDEFSLEENIPLTVQSFAFSRYRVPILRFPSSSHYDLYLSYHTSVQLLIFFVSYFVQNVMRYVSGKLRLMIIHPPFFHYIFLQ